MHTFCPVFVWLFNLGFPMLPLILFTLDTMDQIFKVTQIFIPVHFSNTLITRTDCLLTI